MTNQNKYFRYYNSLIERAISREKLEGYIERHHVVPRCMGGGDEPENIVELTAEEHYTCHLLLVKMYPLNRKLVHAARLMTCKSKWTGGRSNNKLYGWLKRKKMGVDPCIPRDELYNLYVEQKLSTSKIAKQYNISAQTVSSWLKKYNIYIRTSGEGLRKFKLVASELHDKYIDQKMTLQDIANIYGCTRNVIRRHLIEFNIPIRGKVEAYRLYTRPPKSELIDLYGNKRLTVADIAEIYGTSTFTISSWIKYYRIQVIPTKERNVIPPPPKEELVELRIAKGLQLSEIAKLYNVKAGDTIKKWLLSYGIYEPQRQKP
jgi:transposase-like protein